LAGQVWERIRVAAHASDGGLIVARNGGNGTTTFELRWQEGQPARSLQITVRETDGMIQASWMVAPGYGRTMDAASVAASDFEIAKVESAILLLVDQPRWAQSAVPTIPW
jgi:hypothetical protein